MKRLLVLSGKGGTGKTTVSAAFVKISHAKAVADCDVDAPNLHLVMEQNVQPQLIDFMGGDKAIIEKNKCIGCGVCVSHCRFEGIKIVDGKAVVNEFTCEGCGVCTIVCENQAVNLRCDIAGKRALYLGSQVFSTATLKMGRGNSGKLVAEVKKEMIKSAPECDLAIIDGSPGLGCPVIASVSGVELVLIVAEPSYSGISDLKRLIKTIETLHTKIAVCVNKYDISVDCTMEIEELCSELGIPFVGKIPFDKTAIKVVNSGNTIVDVDCPSGNALQEIYMSVLELF